MENKYIREYNDVPAEAAETYEKYVHFCDECPKAYDFTCSGADSERCGKVKKSLLDEFFEKYDRRIFCIVLNKGVVRGVFNTKISSFSRLNADAVIEKFYKHHKLRENDEFHFVRTEKAAEILKGRSVE